MDWKIFLTVFGTIFLAELGDKTQLATLLYAAESKRTLMVFLGAASALVLSSFIAVLFGEGLTKAVPPRYLQIVAGSGFVIVGTWVLVGAFRHGG